MAKSRSPLLWPLLLGAGAIGLLAFPKRGETAVQRTDRLVGFRVRGVVPGAIYEIVEAPADPHDVKLKIIAYPPKPGTVGSTFPLRATIRAHGVEHPTVRQVKDLYIARGTATVHVV